MILNKITIKNFASIDYLEFSFEVGNVFILSGANGSGKSVLLDAISWCLFGVSRAGNTNVIPFHNLRAKSEISLCFTLNNGIYLFTRRVGGSPTVRVFCNDLEITNAESKDFFSNIISQDLFYSLCQISSKTFSVLSNVEKKELVQSVFDFYNLDAFKEKTKLLHNELCNKILELAKQRTKLESSIEELTSVVKLVEEDFRRNQESIISEISEYDEELCKSVINSCKADIESIKSKPRINCVTCFQLLPFSEEDSKLISTYQDRISFYRNELGKIEVLKDKLSSITKIDNAVYVDSTQKISTFTHCLSEVIQKQNTLNSELRYLEFWLKGFSNTGIANLVLQKMLESLSNLASEFLSETGSVISIENKSEKLSGGFKDKIDIRMNSQPLESCSSGERKRVDLSILSALRTIYKQCPSILTLDETFDSLDEEGCIFVLNMLSDIAKTQNICIILSTHLPEIKNVLSESNFSNLKYVEVTKQNGNSSYKVI